MLKCFVASNKAMDLGWSLLKGHSNQIWKASTRDVAVIAFADGSTDKDKVPSLPAPAMTGSPWNYKVIYCFALRGSKADRSKPRPCGT